MTNLKLETSRNTTIQAIKTQGYWNVVEYDANWNKVAHHGQYANMADTKIAMVTVSLTTNK